MTPDPQAQQGGNGQRFNPLAMLMGGGQGGSGGRKDPGVQLSIGVDRRTSHLIVACNESLFRQIESLVKSIDERARDARQTVRVMHLETADPTLVSSTLTSLIPKVTITATRGGANRRNQGGEQPGAGGGAQPPDAVRDPQLIQRMQQGQEGRNRGGGTGGGGQRPNFGNGGGGGGQRPNFGGGGGTNIPRPNGGGGGRGSR